MVTVTSGPNGGDFSVAGRTVGQIRADFASALSIGASTRAVLNGEDASDLDTLAEGDRLAFVPPTGEKG